MRIFLDTNVLASAFATRGLCADVFREALISQELVVSESLVTELDRVLREKFGASREVVDDVLELLQQDAIVAGPDVEPRVSLKDKEDLVLLSCALAGDAELFVTGDKELLALGRVHSLEIVSPRQFWDRLRRGPAGPGERRGPRG